MYLKGNKITGSKQERRISLSKEKLINGLPVGKWFRYEDIELDINAYSFKRRVAAFPFVEMKCSAMGVYSYLVSARTRVKLENWLSKKDSKLSPKKNDITKHDLTIEDKLLNLVLGGNLKCGVH